MMATETAEKTWTFMDRTGWGSGPWDDEPDKVEWRDKETGLPCIARRSPAGGAWCGYAAVPEGHPLFGKEYDEVDVEVHGGLTYAAPCYEDEGEHAICHVPLLGESDSVYWFGFDCGHLFDLSPGSRYGASYSSALAVMAPMLDLGDAVGADDLPADRPRDVYRTLDYVKGECTQLARQLAEVS